MSSSNLTLVLLLNKFTQADAVLKYNSGIASYYADGQIGFTKSEDADYFIEHWDSKMHDYKDAMPDNRDVSFSVFHKKPDGGLFEDGMIKRVKDSTS